MQLQLIRLCVFSALLILQMLIILWMVRRYSTLKDQSGDCPNDMLSQLIHIIIPFFKTIL